MKKKLIALTAALLAAAIFFYLFLGKRNEKHLSMKTSGVVEGVEVNISSKESGRISYICCNEGDAVKEGQTVIRLESEELKALVEQATASLERAEADLKATGSAIEDSKANVQSAEAEIKSAEAEVEKARAQMDEAKKEFDRADALSKEELVSRSYYDQKLASYETAAAAYKASKENLSAAVSRKNAAGAKLGLSISQMKSSKARLKESEANLSFNRAKLGDTVITSPVAGVVIFKSSEKGETVTSGATIMTVVDTNNLYVRADVEETLIGSFSIGSEAVIKTEGIKGQVFGGKVSEIGSYAEFATQRDVERGRQDIKTFRVKIRVENPEGLLKPGMTVSVEIPKKI